MTKWWLYRRRLITETLPTAATLNDKKGFRAVVATLDRPPRNVLRTSANRSLTILLLEKAQQWQR